MDTSEGGFHPFPLEKDVSSKALKAPGTLLPCIIGTTRPCLHSTVEDGHKKIKFFYSILAKRRKQKDWFLWKNMHQSKSKNWENSSSMLKSIKKSCISMNILGNRCKQKDCFYGKICLKECLEIEKTQVVCCSHPKNIYFLLK